MSPWPAPALFGKKDFSGQAQVILDFILKDLLVKYNPQIFPVILLGYSLGGLFSLWSSYQTKIFACFVPASPSVWYQDWDKYIDKNTCLSPLVYLSLGDKEAKTKNQTMAQVADRFLLQADYLKRNTSKSYPQWNSGNHVQNSEKRLADGIQWVLDYL